MKHRMQILFLSALLAGSGMFLGACVGGYVGVNSDYYGPAYGGVVIYGHPYYGHGDGYWGGPRGRRWR